MCMQFALLYTDRPIQVQVTNDRFTSNVTISRVSFSFAFQLWTRLKLHKTFRGLNWTACALCVWTDSFRPVGPVYADRRAATTKHALSLCNIPGWSISVLATRMLYVKFNAFRWHKQFGHGCSLHWSIERVGFNIYEVVHILCDLMSHS
jgi:hypothetical protein